MRALLLLLMLLASSSASAEIQAGFGEADITPEVGPGKTVWLAGYGFGRPATGVHDPLFARAVVLRDAKKTFAFVSVDLVGVQYPLVVELRKRLPEIDYVLLSSTHNHEGPDVIGIWGATPLARGVDDKYLELVVTRSVEAVRSAAKKLEKVTVRYGTAEDESLLGDSRLPKVYDGVLRVLTFAKADGKLAGLLVQWNCHPEALGRRNTLVTADFPYATVAALKEKHGCPIAYFSGAVGGLMAPPDGVVKDAAGSELKEGDYAYAERYGRMVADLANKAVAAAEPIELAPLGVWARPMSLPVTNDIYRLAAISGAIRRGGRRWSGDPDQPGEKIDLTDPAQTMAVETEVAYLRLGQLDIAAIPGEIYPELVYGKFQDPAEPNADFPDAPLEPTVAKLLPQRRWLLFGLANDEIGYIIPKRQWDRTPPFAYGRQTSQYGEINSCGPDIAPLLMDALKRRVLEAR